MVATAMSSLVKLMTRVNISTPRCEEIRTRRTASHKEAQYTFALL